MVERLHVLLDELTVDGLDEIPESIGPEQRSVDSAHKPPWTRPEAADVILNKSGVRLCIGGDRAFYSPATDHIQLPPEQAFRGPTEYFTTALHELAHATGHPSRLNRDLKARYGSAAYAMEELRAEISSAYVASELGLPPNIPQHASYINSCIVTSKQ